MPLLLLIGDVFNHGKKNNQIKTKAIADTQPNLSGMQLQIAQKR